MVANLKRTVCNMVPNGATLSLDVPGAYLLADPSGPPVFLEIDEAFRPASWSRLKRPCVLIKKALYGLARSGDDWHSLQDAVALYSAAVTENPMVTNKTKNC